MARARIDRLRNRPTRWWRVGGRAPSAPGRAQTPADLEALAPGVDSLSTARCRRRRRSARPAAGISITRETSMRTTGGIAAAFRLAMPETRRGFASRAWPRWPTPGSTARTSCPRKACSSRARLTCAAFCRDDNELLLRFHALGPLLAARRPRPKWRTGLVAHQQLRWHRTALLGRMPAWCPPVAPVGPWRPILLESARSTPHRRGRRAASSSMATTAWCESRFRRQRCGEPGSTGRWPLASGPPP